jgi:hypothetical protein
MGDVTPGRGKAKEGLFEASSWGRVRSSNGETDQIQIVESRVLKSTDCLKGIGGKKAAAGAKLRMTAAHF